MTRLSVLLGACLLLTTLTACAPADSVGGGEGATVDRASLGKPTEVADQVAYSMGLQVGRNISAQDAELNVDYVIRGLEDAVSGAEPLLTDDEIMTAVQAYQTQLMNEAVEQNRAEGEAFLASNAERSEVTTLPSGLQYEVVKQGDGAKPGATDRVTVHYRGSLVDGTQFDSSYDRGQPATFRLDAVIPGWSEGLQQMNVGSIYKLFIPGALAYGASPPPGGPIGPEATLVFVVELLEIASE
jgi:FKBP-type peptidyl-prolyl cis-trans isomerase